MRGGTGWLAADLKREAGESWALPVASPAGSNQVRPIPVAATCWEECDACKTPGGCPRVFLHSWHPWSTVIIPSQGAQTRMTAPSYVFVPCNVSAHWDWCSCPDRTTKGTGSHPGHRVCCSVCPRFLLVPEGSSKNTWGRCALAKQLLGFMAEFWEEVDRLRSIQASEKEIDWWVPSPVAGYIGEGMRNTGITLLCPSRCREWYWKEKVDTAYQYLPPTLMSPVEFWGFWSWDSLCMQHHSSCGLTGFSMELKGEKVFLLIS